MKRTLVRSTLLLALLLSVDSMALAQLQVSVADDPLAAEIVYDDVENFLAAVDAIGEGRDAIEAMEELYLSRASLALQDQIESRGITAEEMAQLVADHPDAGETIRLALAEVRSREDEIRGALKRLDELFPDAKFLPNHFMVGPQGGWMGEPSPGGIKIVMAPRPFDISRLAGLVLHENIHVQQAMTVGLEEYQQIYGPKMSLLALSVREGVPSFFTRHLLGEPFYREAYAYLLEHEEELWRRFDEQKLDKEPGDWMWREPSRDGEPRDLGYLMGAAIVESYYEAADDKAAAVRRIFGVVDAETFLAESGYPERFTDE